VAFFGLGSPWEAEARGRLGMTYRVLRTAYSSVALAPDSDTKAAIVLLASLLASLSASFSASWYSVIPRIQQPLVLTLALYVNLMPLMHEVFIPNPGTLFA